MLTQYNPDNGEDITLVLANGKTLKGEFFDGERIDPATLPKGKFRYQTRHNDNCDWSTPVTIRQGMIMVNFCGTVISDTNLDLKEETEIIDFNID